ncbi:hypothetical protein CTAYLR_003159 [Chrysophaeum taylorii]|uniref:Bromo domain-containing protein n=1 Tax=Chrysophaeum taylorii TaxID=2483200 RepID=A0AAD7XRS5_9STRA|nr:hypothetical protein CTAYLR_003159 [Chrysophaeum taylorii]
MVVATASTTKKRRRQDVSAEGVCVAAKKKKKRLDNNNNNNNKKKLSSRDAAMTSQRRMRGVLSEPPYDMELVPGFENAGSSVLRRVEGNEAWEPLLAEIVLLCNEAAWRKSRGLDGSDPKPLMLEYVSDRLDTDEPLWGFQIRSSREFWLQGFVALTVFTTWTPYFRFTNEAPAAAITAADVDSRAIDDALCRELEAQRRAGDPEGEGVVWPRVAEISLLGGLGCGRVLASLAIQELRDRGFDYVVLQATDQAIPFYERVGFSRVGAVASFEGRTTADIGGTNSAFGGRLYRARRLARELLRAMRRADEDDVFAAPVPSSVPGYSEAIKTPMDFSTMRRRLVETADVARSAAAYLPEDLEADWNQIVANCLHYNHATSALFAYARRIDKKVKGLIDEAKRAHPALWGLSEEPVDVDDRRIREDFEAAADADSLAVMGYVHWTFPDQPVEDQYPSYLMALRLRDRPVRAALSAAADAALVAAALARDASSAARARAADKNLPPPPLARDASSAARARAADKNLPPPPLARDASSAARARAADKNLPPPPPLDVPEEDYKVEAAASSSPLVGAPRRATTLETTRRLAAASAVPVPILPRRRKRIVPRSNVTPRGRGFTAKTHRGAAVEYLGFFDTVAEAQQAYDDATTTTTTDVVVVSTKHPKKKSQRDPVSRDAWLETETERSTPLPLRAADLGAPKGTPDHELRDLATKPKPPSSSSSRKVVAADDLFAAENSDDDEQTSLASSEPPASSSRRRAALYNKVVTISDLPPCYTHHYWFVFTYVPDMAWCHVCPMERHGVFGANSKRNGRPRWRLVPEGEAREIDVSAARCTPIKHETVAKTQSADKEIFDIFESS